MRRKQRIIPIVPKPKNDSLDFVKTIGRLYHDKGDHKNLGRKMGAYFLEHVRSRYKLATSVLNDEFIKSLHGKTGVSEEEITEIVQFVNNIDSMVEMSDKQLAVFHKKLDAFYRNA
jgi:predicted nucleic acid-binding protein